MTKSVLRPKDMHAAELGPVESIWVPLWRFEGSVDGFHLRLGTVSRGGRPGIVPRGGFKHRDRTLYVLARSGFAIDPSPKVRVERANLAPFDSEALDGQMVKADMDRMAAQERAELMLKREGQPSTALYSNVDSSFRGAMSSDDNSRRLVRRSQRRCLLGRLMRRRP